MSLSKKRDRERKKREYWRKKAEKQAGMALLPKALVRRLRRQGIAVGRYLTNQPVSLDDYRAQGRLLEAKIARVEWQSSGIVGLHQEIATLRARLATLPAMQDALVLQRLAEVEAEAALHQAQHEPGVEEAPEVEDERPASGGLEAMKRLSYALHPEWNRGGGEHGNRSPTG